MYAEAYPLQRGSQYNWKVQEKNGLEDPFATLSIVEHFLKE